MCLVPRSAVEKMWEKERGKTRQEYFINYLTENVCLCFSSSRNNLMCLIRNTIITTLYILAFLFDLYFILESSKICTTLIYIYIYFKNNYN